MGQSSPINSEWKTGCITESIRNGRTNLAWTRKNGKNSKVTTISLFKAKLARSSDVRTTKI